MVRRASHRLSSRRVHYSVADLSRLPFAAESFDCATCGFVLEYLHDPCDGLRQIARVLKRRGRLFLFCMFDSFSSRITSDIWGCHTFTKTELLRASDRAGLRWRQARPFDLWQRLVRGNGICGELQRVA
jgi:ubiquinone/menaquinone biosynthesis C-methylase UbiE